MTNSERLAELRKQRGKNKANSSSSNTNKTYKNSDRLKKFRLEKDIDFETFESDLKSLGTTVEGIYNGWQTKDTMSKTKTSVEAMQNRIKSYQDYQKMFGGPDISELANSYETALANWDSVSTLYGQYKNAEAFNIAKKNAIFDEQFKGLSYDDVQSKLKDYAADSDEYKYLSGYTNYSDLNDFNKAVKNASGDYKSKLEKLRNQYALDNKFDLYKHYADSKDFEDKSKYSEKTAGIDYKWNGIKNIGDTTYAYINNPTYTQKDLFDSWESDARSWIADQKRIYGSDTPTKDTTPIQEKKGYDKLNADEIAVYNYIYATEGKDKAQAFLDDMEITLTKRVYDEETKSWENFADKGAVPSTLLSILSVPTKIQGAFTGSVEALGDWIEGKEYNPYGYYKSPSNFSTDTRKYVSENIAEATEGIELFGQNIPSFLYDTGMSIADSAVGTLLFKQGNSFLMGSSAFQQKAKEMVESGEDESKVFSAALASGAAEMVFEYISIDKLLKIKNVDSAASLIKSTLKQAGVEGSEELFTEIANIISDSAIRGKNSELYQKYEDLKSKGYSTTEINIELAKQIGGQVSWSFVGGALSGGVMGGVASANNYSEMSSIGKDIKSNERTSDMFDVAGLTPKESEAYKAYTRYANKGINADNVSNARLGNLYSTTKEGAINTLSSKKTSVEQKTEAIKTLGKLSKIDTQNEVAKISKELTQNGVADETSLTASGEKVDISGIKLGEDTKVITADGKEISSSDITFTQKDADLISHAKLMSEDDANLFIEQYDGQADVGEYADSFNLVMEYAKHNFTQDTILENKGVLSNEQVSAIYGATIINQYKAKQTAIDKLNAKHGKSFTIQGKLDDTIIDYDNTGAEGKVAWNSLNSSQRKAITFMKGLAKGTGMNLELISDGLQRGINGAFEIRENTIILDIYAGMDKVEGTDFSDSIIPTASHEMTHWMKEKSPELYRKIDEFIFKTLMEGGKTEAQILSERRLQLEKNHPNENISDETVRDEVIARACEDMLAMSEEGKKIFDSLSESEKKTFVDKIKDIIQNLKDWVNDLLSQYKSNSPEAREMHKYQDRLNELSKMWDEMLRESIRANQSLQKEGITGEELAKSVTNSENISETKYAVRDFGLEEFDKESLNNIKMRGGIIVNNDVELDYHITQALTTDKQEYLYLGAISEDVKSKIEDEIGTGIFKKSGQYTYSISYDDIRHISKHYSSNTEIIDTVKILFGMLNDYDKISKETLKDGQNRIILEKSLPNADYLTVNIVSSKRRSLDLTTIYITKKNKNGVQLNQPDISNSKDVAQLESNSAKLNISQQGENVKNSDREELQLSELNKQLSEKYRQVNEANKSLSMFDDAKNEAQEKLFAVMNKEGVAKEKLDKALAEYSEWEKSSGYAEAYKKQQDINDEVRNLRIKIRDIEDALHKDLMDKISSFSDEDIQKYVSKAIRKYHTTSRLENASYLVTTGSMLDFSEGQGYRVKDHREISEILDLPDYAEYSDGMIAFMNMGNIRLQTYGIDISKAPTTKQKSTLRDIIAKVMREYDEFSVDFSNVNGYSNGSVTYPRGTATSKILADIDDYFKTGVVPEYESSIADFLYSDRDTDIQTQINQSMTMADAKQMVQRAFILGGIEEWYDGEYKNGDEWLKAQGVDEVALYIENEYTLQEKYIDKIQGILDDEFFVADVLEAYLNGTLTGKEKPKTKRLDLSTDYRINDKRFYSPQRIKNVKRLLTVASQRVTEKNRTEVSNARAKILLFAHNKGASELLGLTQTELNKKLRVWSGYPANAREISKKFNEGVADSNKWTGIENCSWLYKSTITTKELESLVKEIKGTASDYEKLYIARTMLALDTHIDWSWLTFEFDSYEGVNKNRRANNKCLGYYTDDSRKIVVSRHSDTDNTVAHEMGHALDHQWARDLGYSHSALTEVSVTTERITDTATRQFFDNFKIFMDSLTDNGDIRSEYTQDPKEVFARFVAKFIQWVDNTGTGRNTYKAEYSHYKDNFTAAHYIEFVKLLQEKAMLDSKKAKNTTNTTPTSNPDIRYSYRGISEDEQFQAEKLEKEGLSSEEIRQKTGWFRSYDSKWRYEIDDSKAKWHLDTAKPDQHRLFTFGEKIYRLEDLLEHEELYKAYPQLKDVTVFDNPYIEHGNGNVVGRNTDSMAIGGLQNDSTTKWSILHELQHIIQNIEGFARGSSVYEFTQMEWGDKEYDAFEKRNEVARKLYNILRRNGVSISNKAIYEEQNYGYGYKVSDDIIESNYWTLSNLAQQNKRTQALVDEYYEQVQILNATTPDGQYHNTAGEIEAYDTMGRMRMSAEERMATRPNIDNPNAIVKFSDRDYIAYDTTAKLKESTVDLYLRDYASKGTPNYAQAYIAYMTPYDFLEMTTSGISSKIAIENETTDFDREQFEDAVHYQPIQLNIDHKTGEVLGHEGRHRMVALRSEGIYDVPVLLFDSSNKYNKEILEGFRLTGQFNEYHKATINRAIPLNYANRDAILTEFSELNHRQKTNERFGIRETLKYSDRDNVSVYDTLGETDRLIKENEQLKEDVERLKERLKLEKQITHGNHFNENQLDAVAAHIRNIANSTYSKPDLVNLLKGVYSYIATSKDLNWQDLYAQCYDVARMVLDESKAETVANDYFQMIYDDIRSTPIRLSEGQKKEIEYHSGKKWNRAFFGKIKVSDSATMDLDSQWESWATDYPDVFDATLDDKSRVTELYDLYDSIKESKEVALEYDEEEQTRWLAREIYNQYWNVSPIRTTAEKYDKQIKLLNHKHREAMNRLRDNYKDRLKSQHKADKQKASKLIKEIRDRKDKEIANVKLKSKEKMAAYKDNAARKTKIQSITAKALTLNEWLVKNSKEKHIHESLKGPVANLLQAIDFSSKQLLGMRGGENKGVPTRKDISLQKALSQVKDMMLEASVGKEELVDLYGHDLDEDIKSMVESVDSIMRNVGDNEFILNQMTLNDLNTLDNMLKTIKQAVTKMNQFHSVHHAQGIASLGREEIRYAEKLGNEKIYVDKSLKSGTKKMLKWTNSVPYYAFKRFGESGKKIFEAFQDGWDKLSFNVKEVIDFTKNTYTSKEVKNWEKEIKSFDIAVPATDDEKAESNYKPQYQKVKMTTAQVMYLYLLNKRAAAKAHLLGGGIVVSNIETKRNELISQPEGAILEQSEIDKIIKSLTTRQKEVADALSHFMNTVCSDWGNEVSMARFGYKAFGEPDYVPMQVDKDEISTADPAEKNNSLFKLLNMSFTKSLTEGANNRLVISSIFDVFAQHTSDMAKYNALALPVLDAFKWYNYKEIEYVGEEAKVRNTVKKSIKKAFGEDGQHYITTLLEDINGQNSLGRDTMSVRFFKNSKLASVGMNLRVVLLQPTSYFRASANIDSKYLVAALAHKPKISHAEKYCGMALWKSMGYFDTNIQRGVAEQIKHAETPYDKVVEFSMKGAGNADRLTLGYLWNAAELEIRKTRKDLKVGSDEFFFEVGKRLRDIIYSTQVVDSTLTRSEFMRSPDGRDKILSMFASEPTLAYNILQDAYIQTSLDARELGSKKAAFKKNGKKIARAITAYTITNAVAALVESGFDVLRDDDDEELDIAEFMKLYLTNFAADMSIVGKIPYLKDGLSILQGYSPSRSDVQWMQSVYYALKGVGKHLQGEGNPVTTIKNSLKSISYLSGLPFYNAYRDTMATLDKLDILTAEELEEMFKDFFDIE